jgi:hypothetical protein
MQFEQNGYTPPKPINRRLILSYSVFGIVMLVLAYIKFDSFLEHKMWLKTTFVTEHPYAAVLYYSVIINIIIMPMIIRYLMFGAKSIINTFRQNIIYYFVPVLIGIILFYVHNHHTFVPHYISAILVCSFVVSIFIIRLKSRLDISDTSFAQLKYEFQNTSITFRIAGIFMLILFIFIIFEAIISN